MSLRTRRYLELAVGYTLYGCLMGVWLLFGGMPWECVPLLGLVFLVSASLVWLVYKQPEWGIWGLLITAASAVAVFLLLLIPVLRDSGEPPGPRCGFSDPLFYAIVVPVVWLVFTLVPNIIASFVIGWVIKRLHRKREPAASAAGARGEQGED